MNTGMRKSHQCKINVYITITFCAALLASLKDSAVLRRAVQECLHVKQTLETLAINSQQCRFSLANNGCSSCLVPDKGELSEVIANTITHDYLVFFFRVELTFLNDVEFVT